MNKWFIRYKIEVEAFGETIFFTYGEIIKANTPEQAVSKAHNLKRESGGFVSFEVLQLNSLKA